MLVFDRELYRFDSSKSSALELGVRLMCSGWNWHAVHPNGRWSLRSGIGSLDALCTSLFVLLHEIPTAILFAEFGVSDFLSRNCGAMPYRWAPRSLLLLERPMKVILAFAAMKFADPPLPLTGYCEDDGVHIKHPWVVFDDAGPATITRESVLLDTSTGGGEL